MKRPLLAICALLMFACNEEPPPADGFFDPAALEEGTTELGEDFTVVPCPGAEELQRWQWHPRLIRGQVLAPNGAIAQISPPLWRRIHDVVIPSAHAVPLEGESVVEGATVTLYDGDQPVSETTTDALGRFCVVAPEGTTLGPTWRVEASQGDMRLRRVLLDPVDANISLQTEAVFRVVSAHPDATEHTWRNVSTMSATTLDLLEPLEVNPATTTDGAVEAAVERINRDPRISAQFE